MNSAAFAAFIFAGIFFICGLLSGIWKYIAIIKSSTAQAPAYVDIFHRASFTYSFASFLIAIFARYSLWPLEINLIAVLTATFFFTFALLTYLLHGLLVDTDNQFRKPYRLGSLTLPPFIVHSSMILLILGELAGFTIVFTGFILKMLEDPVFL